MSDRRILIDPTDHDAYPRQLDRVKRRPNGDMPSTNGCGPGTILPPSVDLTTNTVGGRLFNVRRMARAPRLAIEQLAGLSRGHYGRIEYGRKPLNHIVTAYRIISAFYRLGVSVDFHWLVLGPGLHDEPEYNERFWFRFPRERPRQIVAYPDGEEAEATPSPPAPRSGVGVKLVAGPPRLKLMPAVTK